MFVDKTGVSLLFVLLRVYQKVAAAAMEVGSRQGKTPIFVKDVAGFYVNRALAPFMSEVTALILEGVDLQVMDKAMRSFGMPVGPITLCGK